MTTSMPFELDDRAIERMLLERAGDGAPVTLVESIADAIATTPQQRGWLVPPSSFARPRGNRTLALAATVALATLAAGAALFNALSDRQSVLPDDPPPVIPTISAPATLPPTRSPSPSSVADLRMIVLGLGAGNRVEIYTLDPFSGDRTGIGILQPQAPMGQTIQWAADRRTAISWSGSDSVHALVDVAGGALRQLLLGSSTGQDAVSPAGDRVARLDDSETGGPDLAVVDLDGNEIFRAALPAGIRPLTGVAWAPDASQVVVSTCLPCPETDPPHQQHLLLVPVGGGQIRDLSVGLFDYLGSAAWSPDMTAIAVVDNDGIMTVAVSGAAATRITDGLDAGPAWSPDGRRIAFTRSGANGGVYVMAADGSSLQQLVAVPGEFTVFDVHWSPDGAWILFSRDRTESSLGDLWIVPSAGGAPRLLVQNAVADW